MLVFSGEKDPVGKNTKSVMQLLHIYSDLGIKDITYHFYKDGRHESLNEINRDAVTKDVIVWLNKQV
jgi:alpha-beta hydrolase superfamily lysophospholipase